MKKSKVRTHRLVIRNMTPSDSEVRERTMREIGDVDIRGWHIENINNFTGPVFGGTNNMP